MIRKNKTAILLMVVIIASACATKSPVATAQVAPQNGAQKLKSMGLEETCINEPVFNGRACVFEANKRASETVVLVHGIAGEAANWIHQINALKERYHVLTFDLPGFGVSSKTNQLYSPKNYARFVHFVTQKFSKGSFHLIGHSMGGAISLRYASMFPEDVNRLIITDSAGILHKHAYSKTLAYKWINVLQRITYWTGPEITSYAGLVLEAVEEWMPLDLKKAIESPEVREIILRSNSLPIAGVAMITEDFSEAISRIKAPTLIVWGEYDLITPLRTGKILQGNIDRSYMRVLAQAGHSSMADRAIEYNQLMMAHLQKSDAELNREFWQRQPFAESTRTGKCARGETRLFEGAYASIDLDGCKLAKIQNAQIGELIAYKSTVEMEFSEVRGKDIAIQATDSDITITSSIIQGKVAIQSASSQLDIAGSTLAGEEAAIHNLSDSSVVFSVSRLSSPEYKGVIHEYRRLSRGQQL